MGFSPFAKEVIEAQRVWYVTSSCVYTICSKYCVWVTSFHLYNFQRNRWYCPCYNGGTEAQKGKGTSPNIPHLVWAWVGLVLFTPEASYLILSSFSESPSPFLRFLCASLWTQCPCKSTHFVSSCGPLCLGLNFTCPGSPWCGLLDKRAACPMEHGKMRWCDPTPSFSP